MLQAVAAMVMLNISAYAHAALIAPLSAWNQSSLKDIDMQQMLCESWHWILVIA